MEYHPALELSDYAEPARVGEGMLRVSVLSELPDLLRDLGHEPGPVLRGLGLLPRVLEDPENVVPYRVAGALLERSVARTGCPHFGLLLGQRCGLGTLGVVGLLVRHSPRVGAALHNLVDCLHFHDRGASPSLLVEGRAARLGYAILGKDLPAADQVSVAAIAIACNVMRELCGSDWHPAEVLLPFRKPRNTGPYRAYFRAPLRFGDSQAALVFPVAWLNHPVAEADADIRTAIEALIARLAADDAGKITGHVRRAVLALLVNGNASESEAARAFAMHRRTLNRRLEREGITFQRILKDVRFELAGRMLRDTDNAVGEIAIALGYSESSSFIRAFRQWSRITPAEWRKRNSTSAGER